MIKRLFSKLFPTNEVNKPKCCEIFFKNVLADTCQEVETQVQDFLLRACPPLQHVDWTWVDKYRMEICYDSVFGLEAVPEVDMPLVGLFPVDIKFLNAQRTHMFNKLMEAGTPSSQTDIDIGPKIPTLMAMELHTRHAEERQKALDGYINYLRGYAARACWLLPIFWTSSLYRIIQSKMILLEKNVYYSNTKFVYYSDNMFVMVEKNNNYPDRIDQIEVFTRKSKYRQSAVSLKHGSTTRSKKSFAFLKTCGILLHNKKDICLLNYISI